jgi:hypothetical protein
LDLHCGSADGNCDPDSGSQRRSIVTHTNTDANLDGASDCDGDLHVDPGSPDGNRNADHDTGATNRHECGDSNSDRHRYRCAAHANADCYGDGQSDRNAGPDRDPTVRWRRLDDYRCRR